MVTPVISSGDRLACPNRQRVVHVFDLPGLGNAIINHGIEQDEQGTYGFRVLIQLYLATMHRVVANTLSPSIAIWIWQPAWRACAAGSCNRIDGNPARLTSRSKE